MRNFFGACLATSMLAMGAVPANAVVIVQDFNHPAINGVASLTIGPITYTAFGDLITTSGPGNPFGYLTSPNGTPGLITVNPATLKAKPIVATIAGGTSFVSVELSGYGGADTWFLTAYDLDGNGIGAVYYIPDLLSATITTLSFSAAGIGSVAFGSQYQYSVFADNFSFEAGVPEPESWGMMIAGFGLIGAVLRRRHATYPLPASA